MRAFRWSTLAQRATATTGLRVGATARVRTLATEAAPATAAGQPASAAGAWVPPPLPEYKYDPKKLVDADLTKFFRPTTKARMSSHSQPSVMDRFLAENPSPTNPHPKPSTLTEALRSSQIIYPQWTPKSVRIGVIGRKIGMTAVWDDWGNRLPMTVVHLEHCQVLQVKNELSKKGTVGVQLGAGVKSFKTTPKSLIVHCLKAGALPKQKISEFAATVDAVLPLGTAITARHFVAGQYLDVTGVTKGKGTQGAMYRWGFGGQPATHGVSLTHRSIGSIGSNQSPGRVFKGKKMAGRMGNEQRTTENRRLYKIDVKNNLLFIRGQLPGPKGSWLELRDAKKRPFDAKAPPPFPTYFPKAGVAEPDELVMPTEGLDPNAELAGI